MHPEFALIRKTITNVYWIYVSITCLNSFMTEVPIPKPVHWFALQINWLVSIWKGLRHERVKVIIIIKPFQLSVAFHIETSFLICNEN